MIDYKTLHRKYKIASFLGKEFNDPDFIKIYNFYKEYMDITKMKSFKFKDNEPNTIYYGYTKDKILIEHDLKTNTFWLHYNKIWSFFETEFKYNYDEIKSLTTSMLKEHLNLKEITTEWLQW